MFNLCFQILLSVACGLEFFFGDPFALLVQVRLFDLAGQLVRVTVADAAAEPALDVVVDDLGETAKLFPNGLGLPHKDLEHAIFNALWQHEVVASHHVRWLQLPVNAPISLLDPAGVPG